MKLNPEQMLEFKKIRKDMLELIQTYPDLSSLMVGEANEIYNGMRKKRLESSLVLHCKKENMADVRLCCIKYYHIF